MTRGLNLDAVADTRSVGFDTSLLRQLCMDRSVETPVLLLSSEEAGRNYRALKAALPRAAIHYAVKPNNHPAILGEVIRQGGSFDVCSAGEIDTVLSTGQDPATLIHSHPIKSQSEFDRAVRLGIGTFVADNPDELHKFTRYADRKLKVLIRYRIRANTHAVVNLQYKFGCIPEDVLPLAELTQSLGHEFCGLCFHMGSQCLRPDNHLKAIATARELIHALDVNGFDTRVIDIGGGFPVEYVQPVPSIEQFCTPIEKALNEDIRPGIAVISEPGRFIAASSVALICSVVGKAERDGKMWYYLDDGLYSTFSGIVYDQCQYPVVATRAGEEMLSVLAGPTCDSFDVMYDGLMIPEHDVGDRVVFLATGAYCSVSGSTFNALRRADYQVVE